MTGVVRVHEVGGPEVLRFEDIEVGSPGPGQALIRQTAVGLNYIDVYFRSGLYPAPSLPFIAGQEGAGVVEAIGDGRQRGPGRAAGRLRRAARRLRRASADPGRPAGPDPRRHHGRAGGRDDAQGHDRAVPAAADLSRSSAGQTILFHAAAGGVGTDRLPVGQAPRRDRDRHGRQRRKGRARQGARLRPSDPLRPGGRGRAGARADRRQGRAGGLRFGRPGHLRALARLPGAARHAGVLRPVVRQDPAVRHRGPRPEGLAVPDPAEPDDLHRRARRPGPRRQASCSTWCERGAVKIEINQRYPLRDAAEAHRALEGRQTTGSTLLLP